MHKFLKIGLIAVGVLSAIMWYLLPEAEMPAAQAAQSGPLNAMFWIMYLLLGVAIVAAVLFTVKNLFSNPAGLKKTLFVLGGLAVVVGISYVLSSGTDVADNYAAMSSESTIKNIGMGLNVFFILTITAVVLMILPGIKNLFSK
ncbi:hypothetical protein [Maribacter sp. 2307ULW6-5]|uniref:hypothetical protein n=1 Tax=Maribacter sp. 2307ULW6-5 TaxID=3386275 RepID=UPI0039BC8D43